MEPEYITFLRRWLLRRDMFVERGVHKQTGEAEWFIEAESSPGCRVILAKLVDPEANTFAEYDIDGCAGVIDNPFYKGPKDDALPQMPSL